MKKKNKLIQRLVEDFKAGEEKGQPYSEVLKLKMMLERFEIVDLELLASMIK